MAAVSSKVGICKLALDLIMQEHEIDVFDIDDPTTEIEKVCARWYDTTRRAVLRKKPWNFAIKRTVLTASVDTPAFGYSVAFDLPNDFVRLATVEDSDNVVRSYNLNYQFEDGQILTNGTSTSNLNLKYVYDFTNVVKMDAIFVDLLAVELALRMCYKFTSSNTNIERLKMLRDDRMAEAGAIDGQERPPTRVERSTALQRRRTLGSNQRTSVTFD